MGVDEEVWRIRAEVLGLAAYEKLEQQLKENEQWVEALRKALGQGTISEEQFAEQTKQLVKEQQKLGQQLQFTKEQLEGSTDAVDQVAGKVEKSGSKVAGFGQSMLQTGRVVQDFTQGGLGGILNNIEQLVIAFGGGAGAAGLFTVIGVGFLLLKPIIKDFWDSLSPENLKPFEDELVTLKEKIKKLEEDPLKLAVDIHELDIAKEKYDQLSKAEAEFRKQQGRQTTQEEEAGRAVQEQLDMAPGGAAGQAEKAKATLTRQNIASSLTLKQAQKDQDEAKALIEDIDAGRKYAGSFRVGAEKKAEAEKKIAESQETARKMRLKLADEAERQYGAIVVRARSGRGPDQTAAMRQLQGLTGISFDTAEAIEKGDESVKQAEEFGQRAKAAGEARRRTAAAQRKKAADAVKDAKETKEEIKGIFGEAGETPVAVGPGKAPKGKIANEKDRENDLMAQRARQIQNQSQFYTGQQFTPEQSQDIAKESLKLQREGLKINGKAATATQATLVAMASALQAMQKLSMQAQQQMVWANQMGNGFRQVANQNQGGMTALQMGRP